MKKRMKNKKGFTLIELIVVIAILGILAAIAIPRLGGFTESARQATDKEAAAILANAAAMYHASNPTDTTVTIAKMKDANLITDKDLELASALYTTFLPQSLTDSNMSWSGDTVTVTLTADSGGTDYTITK